MAERERAPWWHLTRKPQQSVGLGLLFSLLAGWSWFYFLGGIDPEPPVWTVMLALLWTLIAAALLSSAADRRHEPRR
ncbi:hypothetical protein AVL62_10125 [Serinicoccus chungangensis]|uniref:Uncharacterized protein n=1 Tax=Serinicoccus chungangensis TaxID=767452 RepID=A0A0W8I1N7_9MICO|nr:hypothetical protein AVL62_10125 [Serinicoccus chungangensis]